MWAVSSFDKLLSKKLEDPVFRAGFEDARVRRELVDELVKLREAAEITQTRLAEQMGVAQSTLSQFEQGTDPRVSTIQRYARAIGYRIVFDLEASSARTSAAWSEDSISHVSQGSTGPVVVPRGIWGKLGVTSSFTSEASTPNRWATAA